MTLFMHRTQGTRTPLRHHSLARRAGAPTSLASTQSREHQSSRRCERQHALGSTTRHAHHCTITTFTQHACNDGHVRTTSPPKLVPMSAQGMELLCALSSDQRTERRPARRRNADRPTEHRAARHSHNMHATTVTCAQQGLRSSCRSPVPTYVAPSCTRHHPSRRVP